MAEPLTITLTKTQKDELEKLRDQHAKAYVRERAAAILKIAGGQSGRQVALNGLLKARDPDSIYTWVRRYQAEGLKGLENKPGRGRKPAFSPSRGRECPPSGVADRPSATGAVRLCSEPLDFSPDCPSLSLAKGQ